MSRGARTISLRIMRPNRLGATLLGDSMAAGMLAATRIDRMAEKGWRRDTTGKSRQTILLFADDDGNLYVTRDNSALALDVLAVRPRWPVGFYVEGTRARTLAEDIAHEAGLRAMRPQRKARHA